jgi:hypothetical protein
VADAEAEADGRDAEADADAAGLSVPGGEASSAKVVAIPKVKRAPKSATA